MGVEFETRTKVKCEECNYVCYLDEVQKAPNPFDSNETCIGCPDCNSVDSMLGVCTAVGCENNCSMGMPHEDGVYRRTCREHGP